MLKPMIRTQKECYTTVQNIAHDIINYLYSKQFNYVPVRLFEVNSGNYEEYKTTKELQNSDILNDESEAVLYTFREGYIYNEEEECCKTVLSVIYEVIEKMY